MVKDLKEVLLDDFWIMPATPKYINKGVPYITSKNIKNEKIDFSNVNYINIEDYERISKNRPIFIDDILISMIGTLGEVAVVKKSDGVFYGQNMFLVRLNKDKIYQRYFINFFKSNIVKRQLMRKQNKSTQSYLKANHIESLKIPIPDIAEQKKIANKLDKIQEIINIRKKQIEQLDELIKSQFVEMFGDTNIVKSNEKTELKTIMISANNGMARRGNDSDGSIVLRLVELQRNYIDYSNVNKIILKDNEKKKYLLAEGDILFARVNGNPDNVGRCAYYKDIGEDVYHNDHIIRVKFDLHKINPIYLCTLLNDEYGRKEFKNKIKTSAGQYTISQDGVERVKIPLPPIELQNQFADIVKQIDKQKFEIQKSLEETQKLQESLMNKYFS